MSILLWKQGVLQSASGGGGSTPWLPTNEGASLFRWHDASDTSSITDAGSGACSQINDKSGNGGHWTQGTNDNRPLTGTRTENSLNVLDFDGMNDLIGAASVTPPASSLVNFVIVPDVYDSDNVLRMGNTSRFVLRLRSSASNSFNIDMFGAGNDTSGFQGSGQTPGEILLLGLVFDTATDDYRFYINGDLITTATDGYETDFNAGDDVIGASALSGDSALSNFAFCERTVFSDITDTVRQKDEGRLFHKWGITPPVGHPYESAPPTV